MIVHRLLSQSVSEWVSSLLVAYDKRTDSRLHVKDLRYLPISALHGLVANYRSGTSVNSVLSVIYYTLLAKDWKSSFYCTENCCQYCCRGGGWKRIDVRKNSLQERAGQHNYNVFRTTCS